MTIISALTFLNVVYAISETDAAFRKSLKKIAPTVATAGTIDYKNGCATCAQLNQQNADEKKYPLYSKNNNQKIDISVLTEEDANSIFSELAEREDIPFGFLVDGCYARAHKMVRIMDDKGITAGKAFLEGDLFVDTPQFGEVGWNYNVAPVVMVKKGNSVTPYVIDPSLFKKPVPYEEWKALILKKSKSKLVREYYTNRFAYDPTERTSKFTEYQEDSLDDMDTANKNLNRMLFLLNASKGTK
jgi:hypothetical protein